MRNIRRRIPALLGIAILAPASDALAQTAAVNFAAQKQYIRGFGGMVHIPWAGDLSAAERTLAFGNANGQLGFTILRIAVPDGNTSTSSYVATAKAAIAAGGIVFASPWNSSGSMNSSEFSSYADHLSSFVSYMKSQGAELYAISVQNEPDYAKQSGWRAWTAAQCKDFVLNYGDKVGTKLMSCESFNYTKSLYDPILNDSAALAKLGVLGAHLYGTPVNNYPYPLFDQKAVGKVERWMTEHYTDSNTDANAWPNALNVASELHNSMVEAQFNAYTWWYIKRSYGPINNGAVTKRGWCMGHWSKFVRPGFYRVDATKSPTSGVSLSAYRSDNEAVIVAVNTSSSSKSITVTLSGSDISSFDKFTTSSSKNLASEGQVTASGGSLTLSLDASSVTTLHGKGWLGPATGAGGSSGAGGSTGVGGSTGRDAGRGGPDLAGSGGMLGADARTITRDGSPPSSGGASGGGGIVGTGGVGTASSGSGGDGSGGQIGTGGDHGTGGGSSSASNNASRGCSYAVPGSARRSEALAALLLALLVYRRRLRRRG